MIAYIEGKITLKTPTHLIIETGGIGYFINISLNTYSKIQGMEKGKLHTYLHVREDAHLLFGFAEESEKELFIQLISISGIGPNTARMILSSISPEDFQEAVLFEKEHVLKSIKGIGPKSAKRIILELKDKIRKTADISASFSPVIHNRLRQEALSALIMLGFSKINVEKVLENIIKSEGDTLSVEALIKSALKQL